MRKAVITGIGIVSSIGDNKESSRLFEEGTVWHLLFSRICRYGLPQSCAGKPKMDLDGVLDRKLRRFMGDGAAYNYVAMQEAIDDSGLGADDVSNERTGLIMGSGGPSTGSHSSRGCGTRAGPKKWGLYGAPTMSSTNSATLATPFQIKGVNYSISSACSTSAHCMERGGTSPVGEAGYCLCRRGKARLEPVRSVRCHASLIIWLQ